MSQQYVFARTTVELYGLHNRFIGRIHREQAHGYLRSGKAVSMNDKGHPVRAIQIVSHPSDDSASDALHHDSRKLTFWQDVSGEDHVRTTRPVISLKRYRPAYSVVDAHGKAIYTGPKRIAEDTLRTVSRRLKGCRLEEIPTFRP